MLGKKPKTPPIESLIGAGTRVDGSVIFTGGLRVDGTVKGNISALDEKPTTLVLSEQGRINGEIRVTRAVINGEVSGPVYASEAVELMPQARVSGDVHYRSIEVHMGAVVSGKLVYDQSGKDVKVVEFKPVPGN